MSRDIPRESSDVTCIRIRIVSVSKSPGLRGKNLDINPKDLIQDTKADNPPTFH